MADAPTPPAFEKLGSFYLGRPVDPESREVRPEPLLYEGKDLTTHAVCIGMTGSGKTGLAITLIEEALIDQVPVLVIDPKGDMGNLLLAFPDLAPSDFLPWIDEAAAMRKGHSREEHARAMADLWRKGLGEWDQGPERVRAWADAAEKRIFTPGSRAGEPIAVLRSLTAPIPAVRDDEEALRDRIGSTVSGLLGLLGIDADPLRSREHILLANILERSWGAGEDLDLPGLIRSIQSPPFESVGVFDLDSFFAADDRFEFAMRLNNLLASPGFAIWTEGHPLDIQKLLYTPEGKPRVSVVSIAHLDEAERMFFVSTLLNEFVAWTRAQPGSSSLRAILYMDEVFGYLPPTANPPSKKPMLTLLKQARAYGVGVVLSTQNPVDLDYKALSNIGTWWLGRLQTERDKARVMDGLEGAAAGGLQRSQLDRLLSSLDSRVFLMQNVHEDAPVLMHTRWALSYLAGPMTREQISRLNAPREPAAAAPAPAPERLPRKERQTETAPPVLDPKIAQRFLPPRTRASATGRPVYRPAIGAAVTLHHARASHGVDQWSAFKLVLPLDAKEGIKDFSGARDLEEAHPEWEAERNEAFGFTPVPAPARDARRHANWQKMLKSDLYASRPLVLYKCKPLKLVSKPGEDEGTFRTRLRDRVREERDLKLEKLRSRFAPKLARLEERIRTAEMAVEREREQLGQQKTNTAISVGATVLGALFGRKLKSVGTVGRATTAARAAGRVSKEKRDIVRAESKLADLQDRLDEMETDLRDRLAEVEDEVTLENYEVTEVRIPPRKSDITIDEFVLLWLPHQVEESGVLEPLW